MFQGLRNESMRRLRATAWSRGLGGSRGWLAMATAMQAGRMVRRIARTNETEVLFRHALVPGERYEVIASAPPPTRRQRRKAAKATKRRERRSARKAARRSRGA